MIEKNFLCFSANSTISYFKGLCEDTSPSADCAGYAEQHGCAQRTSSTLQGHTTLQQKCRKTCNFCPCKYIYSELKL